MQISIHKLIAVEIAARTIIIVIILAKGTMASPCSVGRRTPMMRVVPVLN